MIHVFVTLGKSGSFSRGLSLRGQAIGTVTVVEVQDERCKCTLDGAAGDVSKLVKQGDYAVLKKKAAPAGKDDKKK